MKKLYLILTSAFALFVHASSFATNQWDNIKSPSTHYFIENKGQWSDEVLYLTRQSGVNIWITKTGVLYDYHQYEYNQSSPIHLPHVKDNTPNKLLGHRLKVNYAGANELSIKPESYHKQPGYHNYFLGNDPSKWASNVGLYADVVLKNVYEGIHLHYYFDNQFLRYDFILEPHANPNLIQLDVDGAYHYAINQQGELTYITRFGEITEGKIFAYQIINGEKRKVACSYQKNNTSIGLKLANYNKNLPLIIDPLVYSSFVGGNNFDFSYAIAIDNNDRVTIAGYTYSTDFPTGPMGAYDLSGNGLNDVFVSQFLADASDHVFSTYIGGSDYEECYAMTMDSDANIYIAGFTSSTNYPTLNAYDNSFNGGNADVIVTKLNSTGTALVYSTYIGSTHNEYPGGIALDASNNAYICGYVSNIGTGFPTVNAYSSIHSGGNDIFVLKLNASGNTLIYSTFVGGNGDETGESIAVDNTGSAYVTGYTGSANFPTVSAYQSTFGGYIDAVIFKLSPSGNTLTYSTYFGHTGDDKAYKIKVASDGSAVVSGYTSSVSFPTYNAYDDTHNGSNDIFVTRINASGNALVASTFFGAAGADQALSIDLTNSSNPNEVIITGNTYSSGYPTTADAVDNTYNGDMDVFITRFDISSGGSLIYSTFMGGGGEDRVKDLVFKNGNVYFTGSTFSNNFPVTGGNTYDQTHNGSFDAYIAKISLCQAFDLTVSNNANTLTAAQTGVSYQWIDCNNGNAPISGATNQSFTPTTSGSYAVILNDGACSDTSSCVNVTASPSGLDEHQQTMVLIYPNPATHQLNLQINQTGIIEIYSLEGKLLQSLNANTSHATIDISAYAQGMYLLRFTGNDGSMHQQKFIKE